MVKFLCSRDLLFLSDFGPSSLDSLPETATLDLPAVVDALKQCPEYQLDGNHNRCGLRSRMLPALEMLGGVLGSAEAVCVNPARWRSDRERESWTARGGGITDGDEEERVFYFNKLTKSELTLTESWSASKGRALFAADRWVWDTREPLDAFKPPGRMSLNF